MIPLMPNSFLIYCPRYARFSPKPYPKFNGDSGQTFRARLPMIIDQAQHFASVNLTGSGGGGSDASLAFREGMDGMEREREYPASRVSP